ncbi:MAG: hypothetical protein JW798_08985 [Prolixibacteraceae bacterium]|nr:hypothetical protein [Prolixibacteraceae bacterium]
MEKSKKILKLFFVIFGFVQVINAQDAFPSFVNQTMFNIDKLATDVKYANSLNNGNYIDGTPYFNSEFENSTFFLKGYSPVQAETKLNMFENRFEYMRGEQVYYVDPALVDSIVFKNKTYIYRDVEYDGLIKQRLVEKIALTNNYELCRVTAVVFKPEVKAGGYIDPEPAKFEWEEPVYLLGINDMNITLTNFSKVYKAFPGKKNSIKKFIRSNQIKKDDEEGLVKLLEYITGN